jgi:hypothetical protein
LLSKFSMLFLSFLPHVGFSFSCLLLFLFLFSFLFISPSYRSYWASWHHGWVIQLLRVLWQKLSMLVNVWH